MIIGALFACHATGGVSIGSDARMLLSRLPMTVRRKGPTVVKTEKRPSVRLRPESRHPVALITSMPLVPAFAMMAACSAVVQFPDLN